MAIDFPASPTNGQTFASGSVTYTWDGVKWTAVAAGGGATDKITEGNTSAEVIDTGSDGRFVVTTEGTEALRVDASQRVGIGTSSPNAPLDVLTSSGVATWVRKSGNPGAIGLALDTTPTTLLEGVSGGGLNVYTATGTIASPTYTSRLYISSTGSVGIGTTSPAQNLHVVGAATTNPSIILAETSGSSLQIVSGASDSFIGTNGSTALRLGTAFTERARIDSSGRLLVGTSTSGSSTGTGQFRLGGSGNDGGALFLTNAGRDVVNTGTVNITVGTSGIGVYCGFLIVHASSAQNNGDRTQTTFSVFGSSQHSSFTATQIATNTAGTSATFTVTSPSAGVIRVTNTRGGDSHISMCFMGTGWFLS